VVGLEVQPNLATLASSNAERNGLGDRITVVVGSVSRPPERITSKKFSHVMMNPPYLEAERGRSSSSSARSRSTVECDAELRHWIVRAKGSLTVIQRADRLMDILTILERSAPRVGDVVVFPLWPESRRKPAIRVIVRARIDVATPFRLAHGLVLHRADGSFTSEADDVLRNARALLI
jgi:tRNA1(Val) A37 N6-methylase TrmN6